MKEKWTHNLLLLILQHIFKQIHKGETMHLLASLCNKININLTNPKLLKKRAHMSCWIEAMPVKFRWQLMRSMRGDPWIIGALHCKV